MAELLPFSRDAVVELSASLKEPEWMLERRLQAWDVYASLPVPTTRDEAWRRTDIRRFKLDSFGISLNGSGSRNSSIPSHLAAQLTDDAAGGVLVEVDGAIREFELSEALKGQGVIFCDMHTAVQSHGELVRKYFMTAVRAEEGKFAALHGAFWRGGTFLYVPRNVLAAAPLHSALWATNGRSFTHTLVILDTNSEATFIDEFASAASDEGQALHNGAIELIVGDGASLHYASLQDFGRNVWQFNHERGRVGRDGKLDWITSVMGTRLTKAFQTSELDAPGAWARMSGIFFGNGRQHIDLDTQQNHNAPDTTSDLLYKGALKDNSRSVWQGMIKALPNAQRIDGFQANRNLMLDRTARADSIPGLEIQADDVRCTHASTVGKLDEEEVFYLMSRGIPRSDAIRMVIQGFFDPVMQRIPFEGVRGRIFERILEKVG
ncbi:MAG TPA: Fe-S cluster assembly protein SufD [Promineifilum sp.]